MTASHLDVALLNRARLQIEEEAGRVTTGIINGSCQDHAAYRERVGMLRGLSTALEIMQEIVRKMGDERR